MLLSHISHFLRWSLLLMSRQSASILQPSTRHLIPPGSRTSLSAADVLRDVAVVTQDQLVKPVINHIPLYMAIDVVDLDLIDNDRLAVPLLGRDQASLMRSASSDSRSTCSTASLIASSIVFRGPEARRPSSSHRMLGKPASRQRTGSRPWLMICVLALLNPHFWFVR